MTLAIPGRLEHATYGSGNRRSIRLSYGTADLRGRDAWKPLKKRKRHFESTCSIECNGKVRSAALLASAKGNAAESRLNSRTALTRG